MKLSASAATAAAILLAAACLPTSPATADDPTGVRGDILGQIREAETKLVELAEATPAAKYAYRPGKGVRSAGEVFLHVAQGNFMLPKFAGVEPPAGMDLMSLDKLPTTKEKTVALLKQSFEHARQALINTPDADLDKMIDMFGGQKSIRGTYLTLAVHTHEHLGQSIAYARMNGIVPPWTAREQRAAAEKAKEKEATK
jgi:uncharacterized damage-inducible protein DinB